MPPGNLLEESGQILSGLADPGRPHATVVLHVARRVQHDAGGSLRVLPSPILSHARGPRPGWRAVSARCPSPARRRAPPDAPRRGPGATVAKNPPDDAPPGSEGNYPNHPPAGRTHEGNELVHPWKKLGPSAPESGHQGGRHGSPRRGRVSVRSRGEGLKRAGPGSGPIARRARPFNREL